MKTNNIRLQPDRLNFPLDQCVVGKLSSSVWIIYGDIPDDVQAISIQIERTPDPETHAPRTNFSAATTEVEGASPRSFRCYFAPFYFPDTSEELKYHVIGLDESGNPRWLGSGALRVQENPASGGAIPPEIIPADTYIRNPSTGLYHKLTATVDEDGNLTIDLASEGVSR